MMKNFLKNSLQRFGGAVFPFNAKWDLGDIGVELQRQATTETATYVVNNMLDVPSSDRWESVHDKALSCVEDDGLVLEFGVYSARTTNYIAQKLSHLTVHGFDSFLGLPENWRDGFPKGHFEVDSLPQVQSNVRLHQGWFDETLPRFLNALLDQNDQERVSYLHIDCDLYSSTKTVLGLLGDRIRTGSVIVFDEYFNYPGWRLGEYLAFKEFTSERSLKYEYISYNRKHEQVALKIS